MNTHYTNTHRTLLLLLRKALDNSYQSELPMDADWESFLHGHLLLKHIVDWVVLRRQLVDWDAFHAKCKAFKFDKFLPLIDAFADVVEGNMDYDEL